MSAARALLPIVALVASSCTAVLPGTAPPRLLPAGQWGGDQIGLTVAADGSGRIELSCADAGFTGPVALDQRGQFLAAGHFTRAGGPVQLNPPPPLPATISGRLERDGTLWLDIALADSTPVRGARLKPGADPHLMRCL